MGVAGKSGEKVTEEGELRLADGMDGCRPDPDQSPEHHESRKCSDKLSDLISVVAADNPSDLVDEPVSFPRTPIL
jgi:hypothetical protein